MSPMCHAKGPEEDRPAGPTGPAGEDVPSAASGPGAGAPRAAAPRAAPPVLCVADGVPLEPGKVEFTYQGHTFPVDMLRCPVCGIMLVPEDLARGRMREVEQTLEEK